MLPRSIITVVVSLAWLVVQTVAVTSHCLVIGDTPGIEHHSQPDAAGHAHDPMPASSRLGEHSHIQQHSHSVPAEVPHQSYPLSSNGDCSVGCVALAQNNATALRDYGARSVFAMTTGLLPNPETVHLPTPPPNTVL